MNNLSTGVTRFVSTLQSLHLFVFFPPARLLTTEVNATNMFVFAHKPKYFWRRQGQWRYISVYIPWWLVPCSVCGVLAFTSLPLPFITRSSPTSNLPGVPPWNNEGCKMHISLQVSSVNPKPKAEGKNVWHPPSKQVRAEGASVGCYDKTDM